MKTGKKPTIKQIAEIAGVSPTAVSFALNNKKGISAETEKKILSVIRELDYVPDKNSLRLNHKKSYNICLVMNPKSSPFDDLFYMEVAKGIVQKGTEYHYNVVMSQIEADQTDLPDIIRQNDADGAIFFQNVHDELLAKLKEEMLPCVFVDAYYEDPEVVMVNLDTEKSCYTAVRHLIQNGHRKIAMIGSSFLPGYYETTERGYRSALAEDGIAVNYNWVCNQCQNERDAYLFMEKLLKERERPTAVFGVGDIYAIGAMHCAMDHGFAVPDDFSFAGVDDIILSKYISVPLTTIGYDKIDIGRLAMAQVMDMINGKKGSSIVVPSDRLIQRKSVKNIKGTETG